jgi:lactoylglutathione lyase
MKSVKLPITGLQHVGIPVTDLKASQEFYQNLGFITVMEAPFDFQDEKGKCIMMKMKSLTMELYEFPASELQQIRNRNDGHIDHIAFDVTDIDDTFAMLKSAGHNIVEESPVFLKFWTNGCRYFNIIGLNGERLEFNQIL